MDILENQIIESCSFDEQVETVKIIYEWAKKCQQPIIEFQVIGKEYDTIVLDTEYNENNIIIGSHGFNNNGVTCNKIHIKDKTCFQDFQKAIFIDKI